MHVLCARSYFEVLPRSFTTPFYFSDDELDAIRSPIVVKAVLTERMQTRARYDTLRASLFSKHRDLFPKAAFSWNNWKWASSLYNSRVIQLNMGLRRVPTFVPLVDMVIFRCSRFCVLRKLLTRIRVPCGAMALRLLAPVCACALRLSRASLRSTASRATTILSLCLIPTRVPL